MHEMIKCTCGKCGAKYRLPPEAQGRVARCKRCGEKFEVPRELSLEDSILSWLAPEKDDEEEAPAKPRVISMPNETESDGEGARRVRGTIRMKSGHTKEGT